ncbi:transglycosylase domain-containing protein [Thermogemmatispora onikobensis]|uniref:transglycosylase domain-containing protein n=1 Tax=Thermogemmatispora onikobensis TaxID=732234 RepID=UPI000852B484|nr:transglycosylase domain-containing protein [Thermogemmatispora onikobensis]
MSNSQWKQPFKHPEGSSYNGHQQERASGSLLRRYGEQPAGGASALPSQPAGPGLNAAPGQQAGYPTVPQGTGRAPTPLPLQAGPSNQEGQPRRTGLLSGRYNNWVSNVSHVVRRWSGKVVAVAGNMGLGSPSQAARPLTSSQVLRSPALPTGPGTGLGERPAASSSQPGVSQKGQPWRRSRTLRISMLRRRRRQRLKSQQFGPRRVVTVMASVLAVLVLIFLSTGGASAYAYYQEQYPRVQQLASQHVSQTSRIYDRNMNLLYQAYDTESQYAGRRTPVAYKDIPMVMQQAMVAAEDPTFWQNAGFDPQGILRAFVEHNGGGSGLTQQLIKNLTHDDQYSYSRKITEAALAIALTQQYPKWKILEMYFNVAPFGAQELGIEAAVEDYFDLKPHCDVHFNCIPGIRYLDVDLKTGKHDPLLGLARASFLAGLPQNPDYYDPSLEHVIPGNIERALNRQKYVLNQMIKLGMVVDGVGQVTPEVAAKVEAISAQFKFHPYVNTIRAPHFVFWVITQIEDALGHGDMQAGKVAFLTGGFNIRTTVDVNLETFVEKAIDRHLNQPECRYFASYTGCGPLSTINNVNDAAVVVMDAKTGEILAMDGSSNWNSNKPQIKGQVNAALSPRQPGSSFKPIVYATAFQMGWYPGIVLPDIKTYFPYTLNNDLLDLLKNTYQPTDYGNTYHNWNSTIREALQNSLNVPAVKAIEFTGIQNVITMAERMGITAIRDYDLPACRQSKNNPKLTYQDCFFPSLALGTAEVPLLQMTGAYQVFADGGMRVPPQGVLDIWDNYGHHLYHYDTSHPPATRVLSPQVAYLMTSVLSDEASRSKEFGGDHTLSMWDWRLPNGQVPDVAAKTGTTDNFKDNWTIGYTPDVVVGVWAGNANNEPFRGNVIGITGAAPIWHSVIERTMGACNADGADIPCGSYKSPYHDYFFTAPSGVKKVCVNSVNGLQGSGYCDVMLEGEEPQQTGLLATNSNSSSTGTGDTNGMNQGNGGDTAATPTATATTNNGASPTATP